jgi:hypothetical protein
MSKQKSSDSFNYNDPKKMFNALIGRYEKQGRFTLDTDEKDVTQPRLEILTAMLDLQDQYWSELNINQFKKILLQEVQKFLSAFESSNYVFTPQPYAISPGRHFTDTVAFSLLLLSKSFLLFIRTGERDQIKALTVNMEKCIDLLKEIAVEKRTGSDKLVSWGAQKNLSGSVYFTWSAVESLSAALQSGYLPEVKKQEVIDMLKGAGFWLQNQYNNNRFMMEEGKEMYNSLIDGYAVHCTLALLSHGISIVKLRQYCDGVVSSFLLEAQKNQPLSQWEQAFTWYTEMSTGRKGRGSKKGEEYVDSSGKYVILCAMFGWVGEYPENFYNNKRLTLFKQLADNHLVIRNEISEAHLYQRFFHAVCLFGKYFALPAFQVDALKLKAAARNLFTSRKLADKLAEEIRKHLE